jgi:hypothetical protein
MAAPQTFPDYHTHTHLVAERLQDFLFFFYRGGLFASVPSVAPACADN